MVTRSTMTMLLILLTFCFLCVIQPAQAQLSVESKSAVVREIVERTPVTPNWQLNQLSPADSNHSVIALGVSANRYVFLCREGSLKKVKGTTEWEGKLSELQLERNSLKLLHQSAVYLYKSKEKESSFLDSVSLASIPYNGMVIFYNSLADVQRDNSSILQVNAYGATCQRGATVLSKITAKATNSVLRNNEVIISNYNTHYVLSNIPINGLPEGMELVGCSQDAIIFASPHTDVNDMRATASTANEKQDAGTGEHPSIPLYDTECRFAHLAYYDIPKKKLCIVNPLADDALMSFSAMTRIADARAPGVLTAPTTAV